MNDSCLWCHEEIHSTISWTNLFHHKEQDVLCENCRHQLIKLPSTKCVRCNRAQRENGTCYDCLRWYHYFHHHDPLVRNESIYVYNDFMQRVIAKWKYRGDYILGNMFQQKFKQQFHKRFEKVKEHAHIIPIPLSEERVRERRFNQAKMLASFVTDELYTPMERIHSEKLSKLSRHERILMKNPFLLREKVKEDVILVDDIYTTGRTIRHAATLLKEAGCPNVYAFTLIRG